MNSTILKNLSIILFTSYLFFACSKTEPEPEPDPVIVIDPVVKPEPKSQEYEISTVKLFGKNIYSIAFDENNTMWAVLAGQSSIGSFDKNFEFKALENQKDIWKYHSPSRFYLSGGDLFLNGLYQSDSIMFYYKNDKNIISYIKNTFPREPNYFYASTSFIYKSTDGNYLLGYNKNVYSLSKDFKTGKTPVTKLLFEDFEADGNSLEANLTGFNGTDRIYYKPYFSFERFAYLDLAKGYVKIKSDNFAPKDLDKFGYGDGNLPNAYIGRVVSFVVDKDNNVYFIENNVNNKGMRVRVMKANGEVKTLVGGSLDKNIDGKGKEGGLVYAFTIALNKAGDLYVVCSDNEIRKISKV